MLDLLYVLAAVGVFFLFVGMMMPRSSRRDPNAGALTPKQYRPRSIGNSRILEPVAKEGLRRAMRKNPNNALYLRHLKQANWYWEPGEPVMPNLKAPYWNLESLWGEKIFGGLLYGSLVAILIVIVGLVMSILHNQSILPFLLGAVALGVAVGFFMFNSPDAAVAGAAAKRQKELALEMGYRIPELRGDVLAGNTIQRAIRNMGRRPGGPFVEEIRRAVTVLDVTKDDALAMDQLIERNQGNELVVEFANNLKMVSRQGGQIGPVLNILAELAQDRLRLQIQTQARKNLQEMTRPIGLSSMMITTLLIIVPAMSGVMGSIGK
ncbi:MAG: type II secretion system F family protein [Chloroflexi bacterium]|nr:type II secretion system F family protein [Chloroflexota bacterium]MCL5275469.1 type II secretion system F family protein [Chloroflexota bacterium]